MYLLKWMVHKPKNEEFNFCRTLHNPLYPSYVDHVEGPSSQSKLVSKWDTIY